MRIKDPILLPKCINSKGMSKNNMETLDVEVIASLRDKYPSGIGKQSCSCHGGGGEGFCFNAEQNLVEITSVFIVCLLLSQRKKRLNKTKSNVSYVYQFRKICQCLLTNSFVQRLFYCKLLFLFFSI